VNQMTNRLKRRLHVELLDTDGQPFSKLPDGASITYIAADDTIVGVEPFDEPGDFDRWITSGKDGTTDVVVHIDGLTKGDGTALALDDLTFLFEVTNSDPATLAGTVGAAVPE